MRGVISKVMQEVTRKVNKQKRGDKWQHAWGGGGGCMSAHQEEKDDQHDEVVEEHEQSRHGLVIHASGEGREDDTHGSARDACGARGGRARRARGDTPEAPASTARGVGGSPLALRVHLLPALLARRCLLQDGIQVGLAHSTESLRIKASDFGERGAYECVAVERRHVKRLADGVCLLECGGLFEICRHELECREPSPQERPAAEGEEEVPRTEHRLRRQR